MTQPLTELCNAALGRIDASLSARHLDRIHHPSPEFFKRSVLGLPLALCNGGISEVAGRAPGKSGHDGVTDQDPFGVDQVYVQVMRYAENNNFVPSAVRDFFQALDIKKNQKGIMNPPAAYAVSLRA